MQRLIILHTNDVHGRVDGLARIATLVERIRGENPGVPVLYFDVGDVEEPSMRLSNLTKGAAMHRLLSVAGCDAAAAGNGAWLRYGLQVLADHGTAAHYPLLLANLRMPDGNGPIGVRRPSSSIGAASALRGAHHPARGVGGVPADSSPGSCQHEPAILAERLTWRERSTHTARPGLARANFIE